MKLEGNYKFEAAQDRVWAAFTSAECLQNAIPGCESMKEYEPGKYDAHLKIGIPAVKGSYSGKFEIVDAIPPNECRMVGEGSGTPGFVKCSTKLALKSEGSATIVTYDANLEIGGLIAGVGQRMIGGISKMLLNQFFKRMSKELDGVQVPVED
jgi:carbon monoxide dehydrogenase subunit G